MTAGPIGPGTRFAGTTRILGLTGTYTTEVTAFEPCVRYAWRGIGASGPVMGVMGSYELAEAEGGTRFRLTLEYTATSLLGALLLPGLRFVAGMVLRRFVRQLDELVTGAAQP